MHAQWIGFSWILAVSLAATAAAQGPAPVADPAFDGHSAFGNDGPIGAFHGPDYVDPGADIWGLPHNEPTSVWGLTLTVPRFTTIGENLRMKQINFLGVPVGQPGPETHNLVGFSVGGTLNLSPIMQLTANVDFAGSINGDIWSVPQGAHTVASVLLNVDPLVEKVFYGVGVDVYAPAALDKLEVPGGVHAPIIGQIRGGAGVSTSIGDWVVRGGGRLSQDYEALNDSVAILPDGTYQFLGRPVYFTTEHYEAGLLTCVGGRLYLDIMGGYKTDPDTGFIDIGYRWFLNDSGTVALSGDFYADKPDNYAISLGLSFNYGGATDFGFRRVLRPYTVAKANKMTNWGLFQTLNRNNPPN